MAALGLAFYNGLIAFQVWRDREALLRAAALEADRATHLLGEQFASALAFISASLETLDLLLGRLPEASRDGGTGIETVRAVMEAKAHRLGLARGFLATRPDGRLLVDELGPPAQALDLSDRDYFRAHLQSPGKRLYIGEPVLGRTSGQWFIGVSTPRSDPENRFAGVLAAIVDPVRMARVLAEAIPDDAVGAVVDDRGLVLARTGGLEDRIGRPAGRDPELSPAPGRLRAAFAVPEFPLTVIVSMEAADALRPWHDKLPYFGLVMVLPSVAGLAALALIRRNQRALDASRQALERHVAELQATRARLEEQATMMQALAGQNALARSRAEAANMAKSVFLANMSHELRTPLNAIIGFGEIIARQELGPLGHLEYVSFAADIQTAGRHLLDMINDILDISKIEANKYVLNPETISLHAVVDACVRIVRGRARDAGIEVTSTLPPLDPLVADERAIRQVLINLLANAIKFTGPGGRVTLGAEVEDDRMRISVTDTGVGIRAEDIPKLGRPFEQAGNQPRDKASGTGLGLALSRRLVELHGGRLQIESELGRGTTVWFTLPLNGPPPALPGLPHIEAGEGI
ncbi:sensor histidine kinase [Arenibaculum pallidiluteum]|uniref:sensor histidine kinase n=1 Tax=Arenibaculum pallidiluteum TaxID=2812559 RepID=UPI001A961729|nr:hybrid sensor histidine kinase/response regulator [Arenibaculum pallidiluteum]